MLNSLVKKAESAKSKWWKWLLGALITVVLAIGVWRLARIKDELRDLKLAKLLADDRVADLKLKKMQAKHDAEMNELQVRIAKAEKIREDRIRVLKASELEYAKAKEAVDKAKNWKELNKVVS
jgi:hypothetical protein